MYGIANAVTEIIIWEGAAKGIDDATLAATHLSVINVRKWYGTLKGGSFERVSEVWKCLEFRQPDDIVFFRLLD